MKLLERFLLATLLGLSASCQSSNPDLLLVTADTKFEEGDFQGAIVEYSKVLQEHPENLRATNNRGVAKLQTGNIPGAIKDFNLAIALDATFAEAYYNRGLARFKSNEIDGAIADYTEALRCNARYGKAWAGRGIALLKKGDRDGAVTDFKTALSVSPADWPDRRAVEAELAKLQKPRDDK